MIRLGSYTIDDQWNHPPQIGSYRYVIRRDGAEVAGAHDEAVTLLIVRALNDAEANQRAVAQ
jgi:hypothetical protein